jgi:hypothetical protein
VVHLGLGLEHAEPDGVGGVDVLSTRVAASGGSVVVRFDDKEEIYCMWTYSSVGSMPSEYSTCLLSRWNRWIDAIESAPNRISFSMSTKAKETEENGSISRLQILLAHNGGLTLILLTEDLGQVDCPRDRLLPHPRLERELRLPFRNRRKLEKGKSYQRLRVAEGSYHCHRGPTWKKSPVTTS